MPIPGVDTTVALSLVAAVGDFRRFARPEQPGSYLGLNPRVRQSGTHPASHAQISKQGRAHASAMLVEAAFTGRPTPDRRPDTAHLQRPADRRAPQPRLQADTQGPP